MADDRHRRFRTRAETARGVGAAPRRTLDQAASRERWVARDVVAARRRVSTWTMPTSVAEPCTFEAAWCLLRRCGRRRSGCCVPWRPAGGRRACSTTRRHRPMCWSTSIAALSIDLGQRLVGSPTATGLAAPMRSGGGRPSCRTTLASAADASWWRWQVDQGHYAPAVSVHRGRSPAGPRARPHRPTTRTGRPQADGSRSVRAAVYDRYGPPRCCGSTTSRRRRRPPGRCSSGWPPPRSTSATGRRCGARRCTPGSADCARRRAGRSARTSPGG